MGDEEGRGGREGEREGRGGREGEREGRGGRGGEGREGGKGRGSLFTNTLTHRLTEPFLLNSCACTNSGYQAFLWPVGKPSLE